MRMKQVQASERRSFSTLLPSMLFWISVVLNLCTVYYVTGHIIDSDTSSTLVFSQHLSEIGKLFSQDWMYSTSIEVISSHLVYMPLFCVLDNWRLIRLIGTIILQTLYILSYAFMLRQAGVSKRVFYLSAALLLLPVSVTYGRIVLYHCFYVPLLVLAFLMLGLVFRCAKVRNWKKPGSNVAMIALCVLSFLGGLGGVRNLMITHAPMVLSAFLFCFLDFYRNDQKLSALLIKDSTRMLLFSVLSAGASFVGFLANTVYLSRRYSYVNYGATMLGILDLSQMDELLYGFFHQFGFRENVNMLSAIGVISLLGLIAGIYFLYASFQIIRRYKTGDNIYQTVLNSFFLFFTGVTVFSFLVTAGSTSYHFVLYLTFSLSWAAPLLAGSSEKMFSSKGFSLEKVFCWITILTLCINGLANVTFFNGSKAFDQIYEGLGFQEMDKREHLTGAADYLCLNNYEIGYATYWEGNITTELTNGQVRLINVQMDASNGNLTYFNWLTSLYLREEENHKPFLLITSEVRSAFESSDSFQYCTLVYEDQYHCVYDILDHEAFIPTLYS